MSDLRAIIFDVDGTLAETETLHCQAFNLAFQRAGLDWDWTPELYTELLQVTGGKERLQYFIATSNPGFRPPGGEGLGTFIARLHRDKSLIYAQDLASGKLELRPGIVRLLREARRVGLTLAIATTSRLEVVIRLLDELLPFPGRHWFQVIGAGDVVANKKPHPDIYLWTLERLRLAPQDCVAIEDSRQGLLAALGAGIQTRVITLNDFTRTQDFSGAALVLDHLGDPERPCRVLQGRIGWNGGVLGVAELRHLHTLYTERTKPSP